MGKETMIDGTNYKGPIMGSGSLELSDEDAMRIAYRVMTSSDFISVCANMAFSRKVGMIVINTNDGGVSELYELNKDMPDPTNLWSVVVNGDRSPAYEDMHPSSHLNVWSRN